MSKQSSPKKRWQVVFYQTPDGRKPVREFLDSLAKTDRAAVVRNLILLEEFGLDVGTPLVKAIRGRRKLWELRVRTEGGAVRIFYFAHTGRRFVLLHGFVKKSRKTPVKELNTAERRMFDFLEREEG